MNRPPDPPPSGGCVLTLMVFFAILFLSLTLAAPMKETSAKGPPFVDTADTALDTAVLR